MFSCARDNLDTKMKLKARLLLNFFRVQQKLIYTNQFCAKKNKETKNNTNTQCNGMQIDCKTQN